SLRDVASVVGVSFVYLGEVERGVRGPIARERWPKLIEAIPELTIRDLEIAEAQTQPIAIDLRAVAPQVRALGIALARRIKDRSMDPEKADELLKVLGDEDE